SSGRTLRFLIPFHLHYHCGGSGITSATLRAFGTSSSSRTLRFLIPFTFIIIAVGAGLLPLRYVRSEQVPQVEPCGFSSLFTFIIIAVGAGFEPAVRLPVRQFSKLVVSATHPSHRTLKERGAKIVISAIDSIKKDKKISGYLCPQIGR